MSAKSRWLRIGLVLLAVLMLAGTAYAVNVFYTRAQAAKPTTDTQVVKMDMVMIEHHDPVETSTAAVVPGCVVPGKDANGKEIYYNLSTPGTGADFSEPDVISAVDNAVTTELRVQYADNKIAECPVHLRSYNGKLVGPTLKARPGDRLLINLVNDLPQDTEMHHEMNTIGALNHTNLHTHGLHTSPVGNSDNVLLDINPGETFKYEIYIPLNQVPGTYWYHAHMHGSTATQMASGMAGALIVMGDQIPGTVDSLPSVKAATEKVLVFQQLIYDETGQLEPDKNGNTLNGFPSLGTNIPYFGPCSWERIKRQQVINGQMFPVLTMAPGEVQRWRMIDAAIRETIGVQLVGPYPADAKITDISQVITVDKDGKSSPVAPGKFITLNEIAVDGIALNKVNEWQQVELNPGFRSDVMVQVNEAGKYFLVDTSVLQNIVTRDLLTGEYTVKANQPSDSLTCPGNPEAPNLLATVMVSGTAKTMSLPTSKEMVDLKLPFKPIVTFNPNPVDPVTKKPISPYSENYLVALEQIDSFEKVDFTVSLHPALIATATPGGTGPTPTPIPQALAFMAADHTFDELNHRRVKLGHTAEWILNTQEDTLYYAHPFHIHINSFQVMRMGPGGVPELIWRDTVMVNQGIPTFIFTRYEDYIGAFVYHCHILDHEDNGMMEVVEVIP